MAEFHIIEGNDADMAREIKSSLFDAFDAIEEVDCSTDEGSSLFEAVSSLPMFSDRRVISVSGLENITDDWARKITEVESNAYVVGFCHKVPTALWKVLSKASKKHEANTSKTTLTGRISTMAREYGVNLERDTVVLLASLGVEGLARVRNVLWQLAVVGVKKPSVRQIATLIGDVRLDGVPWGVTDALDKKDIRTALESEVEVFPLVSYLYNEYSRAARVCEEGLKTTEEIQEHLGCTLFQARKALERSNRLGVAKLYAALDAVARGEIRCKDGTGEEAARVLLIAEVGLIES